MRTKILIFSIVFSLFLSTLSMGDVVAKAFYEGKTIKIIVGFKPGGGTDFYGRLMARYMMKYLSGSRIIVKNIPGAGSMMALNQIYASKPDGFKDIPYIQDIITDPKHKPAIDFLVGLNIVGRPFIGPPGIPQDRLKLLQDAFKKSVLDSEAIKLSNKTNKPLNFVSQETCEKWVEGFFNLPPDVVKMLKVAYSIKS